MSLLQWIVLAAWIVLLWKLAPAVLRLVRESLSEWEVDRRIERAAAIKERIDELVDTLVERGFVLRLGAEATKAALYEEALFRAELVE